MNILACLDASIYAASVTEYAAWIAGRLGASVELLHALQRKDAVAARHDLSGAVGLGAKSGLLDELTRFDEAEARIARERGDALLASAEATLRDRGIAEVRLTHRHGGVVETVAEREGDADLIVMGKRGASADFAHGHLGSKVERVVRASHRPVFMASREFRPVERALVAYDGGASAKAALRYLAGSPITEGLDLRIVMVGSDSAKNRDRLAEAGDLLPSANRALVDGSVEPVLTAELEAHRSDLLVMGAYGHSPLRSMLVGSTTSAMLRAAHLPVLLFR